MSVLQRQSNLLLRSSVHLIRHDHLIKEFYFVLTSCGKGPNDFYCNVNNEQVFRNEREGKERLALKGGKERFSFSSQERKRGKASGEECFATSKHRQLEAEHTIRTMQEIGGGGHSGQVTTGAAVGCAVGSPLPLPLPALALNLGVLAHSFLLPRV